MGENEIKDPREIGVSGLRGLNTRTSNGKDYIAAYKNFTPPNWKDNSTRRQGLIDSGPIESVGVEGFGESRYDKKMSQLSELKDLNESRANIQPWYDQIGAGILKGGVLASTTFADGIAGTIIGAINVLSNADKIADSDNPWRELGSQFINNPFSVYMQDINEKVESVLPNYYTKAEQEDPWWEHMFSANFIGDKFLKNLGFTVGAAFSGKVNAGAISKTMGLKGVRDAFKGAVTTASGRTLNTASEIAKAYKVGDAFMDGVKLTEDLGKAAKQLKNAEWTLKTIGAVSAAMGEGRIEAITNSKEWASYNELLLKDKHKQDIDSIEGQLFKEHPEWFTNGQITNPDGIKEWNKRKEEIDNKYTESLAELAKYRADMANADFGLNLIMLSASNLWQYGRFLSGGYNTGRLANGLIRGSLKEGFKKSKGVVAKQYARALSNPFAEANEEMMQSWFSEGTGLQQASKLNSFYGAKVNPEAEEEAIGFLNSMFTGFSNIYGDAQSWEEGFIGGLTGFLGIPSISRTTTKGGKKKFKLSLKGELWEGLSDAQKDNKDAQSIVDALNTRVKDPEFINYYQGFIRHQKYQNDMEAALKEGKPFDYKNAEHSQFISDAIMFEKAGRLQDLYDIIEEAGNVTENDVDDIKNLTVDKRTGKSIFEGKSNQEILDHVKKQVKDAKDKLAKYSEISTNLKTLYGKDIASEYLEEMTWMMTQIDDWESRFKSLLNEAKEGLSGIVQDRDKRYFGRNEKLKFGDLNVVTPNDLLNFMDREEAKKLLKSEVLLAEKDMHKSLRNMQFYLNIQDLFKIWEARNEFIDKYTKLSKSPELFSKQIQETINTVKEDNAKRIVDELKLKANTVKSIKDISTLVSENPNYKDDILSALKTGDNEDLKKLAVSYEDLNEANTLFSDILSAMVPSPEVVSARNIIQDAIDNAESIEDVLTTLADAASSKIPKEVKDTLQNIVDKFIEQKRSKKTAKPDTKKAKNNVKKVKKGLLELLSDNPNEKDALTDEELAAEAPTATEEVEEVEEGEEGEEGEEKTLEEEPKSLIQILESKSPEELKGIIEKGDSSLSDKDNRALKELARKIYNDKILPATGESGDIDVETNSTPEESGIQQGLRSWIETEFEFNPLKDRTERRAVPRSNPTVQALQQLGAYEFVDSGKLASMLDKDEDLPIHFLISSDANLKGKILLAVKIGEKDKAIKTVVGNDNNSYQVVGILGFNKNNPEAVNSYNNIVDLINDEYAGLKKGTSHIVIPNYFSSMKEQLEDKKSSWDYYVNDITRIYNGVKYSTGKSYQSTLEPAIRLAIDSGVINKKYKKYLNKDGKEHIEYEDALEIIEEFKKLGINRPAELIDFVEKNANKNSSEGSAFVSSYSTKVTHIYSGRMVKSSGNSEVEQRDVTKEFLRGRPLKLGIYYNETKFETPGLDNVEIVPVNINNQNPRRGSVWLMVREADGRYYPKALTVKRFTEEEYPLDEYGDTPIVDRIKDDIKTLIDPKASKSEKELAKYDIKEVLFFPKDKMLETALQAAEGETDIDEAVSNVLEALQSDELNLRFNVVTSELFNPEYVEEILKSGILSTDLYQPGNVNASFDVALMDDEGNPIMPEETTKKGHTGRRGINSTISRITRTLNGKRFEVDSEGNIFDSDGERVSDQNTIDEINLLSQIAEGTISPISGSNNLYLGVYTDSGNSFGIINGKVKTGQALEELKDKAAKRGKKQAQKKKANEAISKYENLNDPELFESADEENEEPVAPIADKGKSGIELDLEDATLDDIEDSEDIPETPIEKAPESKSNEPTFTLTEKFTPSEQKEQTPDFSTFARRKVSALRELGFKNIREFIDYVKDPKNKLPNPETIKTKESFDSLIDTIKNCR